MTDPTPHDRRLGPDSDATAGLEPSEETQVSPSARPARPYEDIGVPPSLWACLDTGSPGLSALSIERAVSDRGDEAIAILRTYFQPVRTGGRYTGGLWDTFDPSATRETSANVFVADDTVSTALLSAELDGRSSWEVLVNRRNALSELLHRLGPDRDLVDEPTVSREGFGAAWELWAELRDVRGLGPTRVSKLIARKRPRLIPIYDSVLRDYVFGGRGVNTWTRMQGSLLANDRRLHRALTELRRLARLPHAVSPLRIFDVLAWMEGTSQAKLAVQGGRQSRSQ